MRPVLERSFWQLLVVYAIFVAAIAFGKLFKYMLHFEVFAILVAVIGAVGLTLKKGDPKLSKWLLLVAILFIVFTRTLPYIDNSVPLGYDPGMYKSAMEGYYEGNVESWMIYWSPRGLFMLTNLAQGIGLTTDHLLIGGLIFLEILLCLAMYVSGKEFFGEQAGIAATLFLAVSVVQFKAFGLAYYKNILAMAILLIAIYFVKRKEWLPAVVTAAFLFGLHRPTFLLFGVSYLLYVGIEVVDWHKLKIKRKEFKDYFYTGLAILVLGGIYYIGMFKATVFPQLKEVAGAELGSGTFINFFTYQYSSLFYLAFACLGFFLLAREKKFNQAFFLVFVTAFIVYFQIIFFKRFIIHLDIFLILIAGYGFVKSIDSKPWLAIAVGIILLVAGAYSVYDEANGVAPFVREDELKVINAVELTELDSIVMVVNAHYSPWVEGYSGRETIAPGLFDLNEWDLAGWRTYWAVGNSTQAIDMLSDYNKPLYIFSGRRDRENNNKYNDPCFRIMYEEKGSKLYEVIC